MLVAAIAVGVGANATPKTHRAAGVHAVALGGWRSQPYSLASDPQGARPGETALRVRPLLVDGKVKEWTTGDAHDVTERSFTVRSAWRLNDALPTETKEHWVWQRGPWLLVDRGSGKITPLRLADYDAAVSDVVWFRDYAAYCGLSSSRKQLYAVVSQVKVRRPLLAKKLGAWNQAGSNQVSSNPAGANQAGSNPGGSPVCMPAVWQREPLGVAFEQNGSAPVSFTLAGDAAAPVKDPDVGDN
jgi:hypothetical protein